MCMICNEYQLSGDLAQMRRQVRMASVEGYPMIESEHLTQLLAAVVDEELESTNSVAWGIWNPYLGYGEN